MSNPLERIEEARKRYERANDRHNAIKAENKDAVEEKKAALKGLLEAVEKAGEPELFDEKQKEE